MLNGQIKQKINYLKSWYHFVILWLSWLRYLSTPILVNNFHQYFITHWDLPLPSLRRVVDLPPMQKRLVILLTKLPPSNRMNFLTRYLAIKRKSNSSQPTTNPYRNGKSLMA